ncbi:hypothetical protein EVB32_055 [Rhizobium phage RHph_TM39]|uniref:Uncharacterized protein n=2 Tax=Cuauhnahuacvirus TaxID=3044696 RepID=A0A7S5R7M8_9CAUD|nr:hypothetical protein PQC16_gp055 [Rhizobium phage RHph_TM30]YP_010671202.1 hypothetical protein PQC17_gp053 [Rhizobium phage RHph_Y65]QIG71526.1 hypothetical protein EVB94_055 [Rhizobium phage RHph_TM40]QIG71889.1 hypothetical protein EVB95_055 [Rhizobium phage RHph_TM2_3B]QIG72251.1 hypothetical protein EVB96_055 [Rhizobium phage RHph_TM3_3_6]QIG77043.1 hypothetical protein EVB32_055 [Rhizobium phage RHph_TM39]QIG77382.1 hypothetical protein EVB61_054 [Rhizobium phage RHph_TM21B]QIG77642
MKFEPRQFSDVTKDDPYSILNYVKSTYIQFCRLTRWKTLSESNETIAQLNKDIGNVINVVGIGTYDQAECYRHYLNDFNSALRIIRDDWFHISHLEMSYIPTVGSVVSNSKMYDDSGRPISFRTLVDLDVDHSVELSRDIVDVYLQACLGYMISITARISLKDKIFQSSLGPTIVSKNGRYYKLPHDLYFDVEGLRPRTREDRGGVNPATYAGGVRVNSNGYFEI